MTEALGMVLDVKERLPQVAATDPHYLVAAHDARNMALSAELFYRTALTRKESRGWFIREDYPERDDAEWLKWVNAEPRRRRRCASGPRTSPSPTTRSSRPPREELSRWPPRWNASLAR